MTTIRQQLEAMAEADLEGEWSYKTALERCAQYSDLVLRLDEDNEPDGFTYPCWVDMDSGTWGELFTGREIRKLYMTYDQMDRFDCMSNRQRIEYAQRHGTVMS